MSEDNRLEKDLVELAKRFANAGNAVYFALSSTLVAFILHIACLSTASWIHNGNTRSGLWTVCNSSSGYECCKSVESITSDKKWLSTSQVFISFGLFPGVIAALSVSMLTCVSVTSENKNKARRVSYMANFIASFVTIIGVSVYGSQYKSEPLLKHLELSVSFILGIFSLFLFFISGVTLAFQRKPDESNALQSDRAVTNLTSLSTDQHEPPRAGLPTDASRCDGLNDVIQPTGASARIDVNNSSNHEPSRARLPTNTSRVVGGINATQHERPMTSRLTAVSRGLGVTNAYQHEPFSAGLHSGTLRSIRGNNANNHEQNSDGLYPGASTGLGLLNANRLEPFSAALPTGASRGFSLSNTNQHDQFSAGRYLRTSGGFGGTRDDEVNNVEPSDSITGTLHTELDDNDLEEDNFLWQINEGASTGLGLLSANQLEPFSAGLPTGASRGFSLSNTNQHDRFSAGRNPCTSGGFGGTRDDEVNNVEHSDSITGTLHTELDDNDFEEDNFLWQINEGIDVVPSDDVWISGTMDLHVQLPEEHFNWLQMSEIDGLHNNYRSFNQGTEPCSQSVEDNLCVICFDNSKEVALVPCGHNDFCSNCSNQLDPRICPECREPIQDLIQLRF